MVAQKTSKNQRRRAPPEEETERETSENPQEKDKKHPVERKREEEEQGETKQSLGSEGKAQERNKQYGEAAQVRRRRAQRKGPELRPEE